jgi:hypothetical protein
MKSKTVLLSLVVWLAAGAVCFASPFMGTWKLNAAKSKFAHGSAKNNTVVYSPAFFEVKVTVDGVDPKGKPTHSEWTGNFDGKDHPVTGSTTADMRSYTKVNDRTLNFAEKKGGKVTVSGQIVVSADGKSRIVTTTSPGRKGKTVKNTAFYDKS